MDSENEKTAKTEIIANGNASAALETNDLIDEENENDLDDLPPLEDIEGTGDKKKEEIEKEEVFDENGYFDILDNKQLLKKTLKEGNNDGQRPQRGNRVTINLKTRLKDDEKLIESQSVEGLQLIVGDYDTIHGVDLVVPLMHKGEIAQVLIAPRFAYGEKGCEPEIPADATLDCIVELLDFEWIDDASELPIEERIKIGSAKKDRGNFWHSREEFSISGHCYKRALDFFEIRDEEMKFKNEDSEHSSLVNTLIELRTTTYNNLAAVHIKTEDFDAALKAVNSALTLQEKNVKALFRKGKILGCLGEYTEAVEVLRAASKLEPENKAIQCELLRVTTKSRQQLANEKVMYKRMLQLDKSQPTQCSKRNWSLKWSIVASGVVAALAVVAFYVNQ